MSNLEKPSYEDLLIALRREKNARLQSEQILQTKTRALFEANRSLHSANENLKKHQRISIENEKMAALGVLIAGLAHEVNNPLGFAMGNLQVLRQYCRILIDTINTLCIDHPQISNQELDEIIQKKLPRKDLVYIENDSENLLEETEAGLNRVKEIVQSLKNFSRKDDGNRIPYDINSCIKSALTILTNEMKGVRSVIVDLAELPKIYCNPNSVTQTIINILSNSVYAMKEVKDSLLKITSELQDDNIKLTFADNGCGISEDIISRIFDPFFTTKPFGKGTGLGLSICFEKIQELNGSIEVSSQLNEGSVIVISLPLESRVGSRMNISSDKG